MRVFKVMVASIFLAGWALAAGSSPKGTDMNKQVTFVDLYLTSAANNVKAMGAIGEGLSQDRALLAEAEKNLDTAIERAIAHVKQVRASGVSGDTSAKLDEVDRQLADARAAARKLDGAKVDDLDACVDGISTHVVAAQQAFRELAKATSYTLLDDQKLGTMPVKGEAAPPAVNPTPPQPGTTPVNPSPQEPTPPAPMAPMEEESGKNN